MCGIAGIIGSRGAELAEQVARMSAAVAHRGPDDAGLSIWNERGYGAAFAHRRLAVIDLSAAGHQPMTTADGRLTIVFNGEIYNYRELRKELLEEGARFRTDTDTEVLLALYARRGALGLDSLRGMFAFVIRDNESGELFAARDRLGIKPFYFYEGEGQFLFASEIRALLASGLVPRVIDTASLSSFLSFGAVQEPRTIIRGVRTLPPAHCMTVDGRGRVQTVERYWQLPSKKFTGSYAEAVGVTRTLLEESVRMHLISDVPLGAFLSGGIDSTAIASLMTRHAAQVDTFTVVFNEQKFSERERAHRAAESLGTHHTEIVLSENDLLQSLPRAVAAVDQPSIDGINTWVVAQATRTAGITVALSGLGGDELFGGYPSFQRAALVRKYAAPFSFLSPSARRRLAALTGRALGHSLRSQKVAATIESGGEMFSAYASMRGLFSRQSRRALLSPLDGGLAERGLAYDLPDETLALLRNGNGDADVFNQISRFELSLYMSNMLLRDTDMMSMVHALEVRVPLLDHKLVEWVYALPGEMKTGRGPKPLLAEALGPNLPAEVANQKKMGFTLPFDRWLHTTLAAFVAERLNDAEAVRRAGLEPRAVAETLRSFMRGSRATSWSRVWGLTVLVDWCGRHRVEAAF